MAKKRLIDAYDLAETIENMRITVAGKPARWDDAKHSVLREIAQAPDVDAVEVVRCKDCQSCDICYPRKDIGKEAEKGYFCKIYKLYKKPTAFCSSGKRKEGAKNVK